MALSDQIPLNSGFHAKSTADEVLDGIDLSGKTAVVTGGYSGLGLETVRSLAKKGAKIFVPVRSEAKAKAALAEVRGDVTALPMDLADMGSITGFVKEIEARTDSLDILINNAGVMACPEARVGPGWESQFGINHMGHFALTMGLFSRLEAAGEARVISLSSSAHKMTDILWDDIQFETTPYDKWLAYGQAKTANALFANALSRRLKPSAGLAFSIDPGGIFTPLQRHLPQEEMIMLGWLDENGEPSELAKSGFKTPEQGASTTVWTATSPKLKGVPGVYCADADIAPLTDPESPMARYMGADPHICDDESAERLWDLSDALLKALSLNVWG